MSNNIKKEREREKKERERPLNDQKVIFIFFMRTCTKYMIRLKEIERKRVVSICLKYYIEKYNNCT